MRVLVSLSILFLFTLFFTFCSTIQAFSSWNVQTVNEYGASYSNGYCPIILDSNGKPHIGYTGYTPPYQLNNVRYASLNGSSWGSQTVARGTLYSLVLSSDGMPHILYGTEEGLMYASLITSNWSIQTVDKNSVGFGSIALDSFGNPHIAYISGQVLNYASWTGSNWKIQTVDTSSEFSLKLSLGLDSNNNPYVLYDSRNLKLATHINSSWNVQTIIPNLSGLDNFGNMVLDSKNNPHFIYKEVYGVPSNSTIVYASLEGASWNTKTVVSNIGLSNVGFLVLDSSGYPHISYVTSTPEVMYATWTGRTWDIQSVEDANGAASATCYLALDSSGHPLISYRIVPPMHGYLDYYSNIKYATSKEATQSSSPTVPVSTSLIIATAISVGVATAAIIFIWKKQNKP